MTVGNINQLTSYRPYVHSALGFDTIFDDMDKFLNKMSVKGYSYPPHNIKKVNDNMFVVEVAVAGFNKDELDISVENGNLVIKGTKVGDTSNYLYKGIGSRSFTKTLKLANTVKVMETDAASLVNGILSVYLMDIIPENKQPKKITISDNS
jgi:molecular chaperone IbpA